MKCMSLFFLRFVLLIISLSVVNGGLSFILNEKNFNSVKQVEHNNDAELLDAHYFSLIADSERWAGKEEFSIIPVSVSQSGTVRNMKLESQDFISSIWQPPKA